MKNFIFILSFLIASQASAQDVWSLDQCINHAFENSLNIQQQNLLIKSNEVNIKEAEHARYPSLNGGANLNFNNGRTINPTSNDFVTTTLVSNGLSISSGVTLYDSGRINKNIKNNRLGRDIALNDKEQQKRDLAINVARQYINVLLAKENIKVSQLQVEATNEQLDRMKKMVDAGVTPKGDLLEVEAQVATNEQNLISSSTNYEIAFIQLQQLLNTTHEFEVEAVNETATLDIDNITVDELLQRAVENHPKFKTFELQQQQNQLNIEIAKASKYPQISAGANIGSNYSNQAKRVISTDFVTNSSPVIINGEAAELSTVTAVPTLGRTPYFNQVKDNLSYGIGFNVNIPIYDNYRSSAAVQRAKLNQQSNDLSKNIELQNLRLSVTQSLTQAKTMKKSFEAAQKTTKARQLSFENAKIKFDIGKLTVFELSNNRTQLQQAQVNEIIAKYNYLLAQKMVELYYDNILK